MQAKPYKIPHPFRKLNKELIDVIVKDIAEGSTHKLASLSNGITPRIMQIWVKQGEIDVEMENDTLCAYLVRSLSKTKQLEVKRCREAIIDSDKGHRGAEWTLEHAYWREFGSNASVIEFNERLENLENGHLEGESNGEAKSESAKQAPQE